MQRFIGKSRCGDEFAQLFPALCHKAGFLFQLPVGGQIGVLARLALASGQLCDNAAQRRAKLALQIDPAVVRDGHDHHAAGMAHQITLAGTPVWQRYLRACNMQQPAAVHGILVQNGFGKRIVHCFFTCLAQESFSPTLRLNTGLSAVPSGSAQK